ncbi:MAG: hypothetical protein ACJ8KU_01140 [Chthoniobacterales bacterium]
MEPKIERVITLHLQDVIPQIPAGYTKPLEVLDGKTRVLLKAAEVEKGMANGRPTVSLASIHDQMPEIFLQSVGPGDTTQIALPFSRVLEEFTKLQVRSDQVRQTAVPQVETPFLKVTLEDDDKFGTKTEQIETTMMPPVRVQPATAEALAAAEPEPAIDARPAAQPFPAPARITFDPGATPAVAARPAPAPSSAAAPRIPFKLSPNGTDVPAKESVPASGGPSVPNLSSPRPPTRIPFKLTAAPEEPPKPALEPWITADKNAPAEAEVSLPASVEKPGTRIRLGLKRVLGALPAFQLTGECDGVPADVRLELPFALVEPQLATGRVMLAPEVFAAAIPEPYRHLFASDCAADVALPLHEVLKNIPSTSLRMRDDQVEQEVGATFETPFSTTAAEDAKRFGVQSSPVTKPAAVEADNLTPEASAEEEPRPVTTSSSESLRTPLQVALNTDEKLDAKSVLSHINRMSGVKASAIMFRDGLSLAGQLPADLESEGLCAAAPSVMQRLESHMTESKLGTLRGMTLAGAKGTITFFMHENLCLAALHSNGEIPLEIRDRLGRIVHELSRKYSASV